MQPEKEFSEQFEKFTEIQNKHKLYEIELDGAHIWRLVRGHLFVHILENQKVVQRYEAKNMPVHERLFLTLKKAATSLIRPASWKTLGKKLHSAKRTLIDIVNIMPSLVITARLLFAGSKKKVLISAFIRNIGAGYRLTSPAEKLHRGDNVLLDKPGAGLFALHRLDTRAFNMLAKWFFRQKTKQDIEPAVNRIADAFADFAIDKAVVRHLLQKQLKVFKTHEAAFLHLFEKSRFEKIYLCWNRYYLPLLSAAKKSGIEASEFQHGTITPYHVMYSWKGFETVPYCPDKLLCFGEAWPQETHLPACIDPVIIGAPHMERYRNQLKNTSKDERRVVVFSQGPIGIKLLQFSVETARLRPDLDFIFKPHPAEHYADATHYVEGELPENFSFAQAGDNSYDLMMHASYQIGVSSTTLNEGMALGNRIVIVPFSSWEYMETAVTIGDATLADTPAKAGTLLGPDLPLCKNPDRYYAPVRLDAL